MTTQELQQIASMTDSQLVAAARVLQRQTKAPLLVGDRTRPEAVLAAVWDEAAKRGLL